MQRHKHGTKEDEEARKGRGEEGGKNPWGDSRLPENSSGQRMMTPLGLFPFGKRSVCPKSILPIRKVS